jgi:small subunit ribosomal protein S15
MLDNKKKQQIIKKFATHAGDTGSSEVQIAILTHEIEELAEHLKTHPKDHSSRRGLLRKVSARRRLIAYLKKDNPESFEELAKKLKLKQARAIKNPNVKEIENLDDDVSDEEIDKELENEKDSE